MSTSGISLYSRRRARRPRGHYKVKLPHVVFTLRSWITDTKIFITATTWVQTVQSHPLWHKNSSFYFSFSLLLQFVFSVMGSVRDFCQACWAGVLGGRPSALNKKLAPTFFFNNMVSLSLFQISVQFPKLTAKLKLQSILKLANII